MCGIVAILSRNTIGFTNPDITAFQQMIYADQLRGHHGTGMFWDNKAGEANHLRGAMNASEFLRDEKVMRAFAGEIYREASFVVGHNRWATKGAHTVENTHPFNVDNVTLVHNGTLYNHRKLKDVEVDSYAITHAIAEKGEESTLKEIDGAFALVWYDDVDNKLYFIRNSQRPLNIITTKDLFALSSEAKLAEWVLARNSNFVTKVEMCEVGRLYTFDPKTREITSKTMELRSLPVYTHQPNYTKGKHTERVYDYTKGYWSNNKWTLYPQYNEESVSDAVDEAADNIMNIMEKPKTSNKLVSALEQAIQANAQGDYKIGDVLEFTPLSIDPIGNGFNMALMLQSGLNTPDVYAQYYNGNKFFLDSILKYTTVKAEIAAVIRRGNKISFSLKNLVTSGEAKEIVDQAEDPMQTSYNVVPINTYQGNIH